MSYIEVTYRLRNPASRPNPFRVSPKVIFTDGEYTTVLAESNLFKVDKFMRSYGAVRKGQEYGSSAVSEDREDDRREIDVQGDVSPDRGEAGDDAYDGSADEKSDAEEETEATDEGGFEGSDLQPVKRRTKAEKEAGLDAAQATEFRASDAEDPYEWFKENYPEDWSLAHPQDQEDLA